MNAPVVFDSEKSRTLINQRDRLRKRKEKLVLELDETDQELLKCEAEIDEEAAVNVRALASKLIAEAKGSGIDIGMLLGARSPADLMKQLTREPPVAETANGTEPTAKKRRGRRPGQAVADATKAGSQSAVTAEAEN